MKRSIELDILRALAILLVFGAHIMSLPDNLPRFVRSFFIVWERCGWAGVDLFFVLSGFLVAGLLFKEFQLHGSIRPLNFLIRRGLKTYPAFYVFILVTLAVRFIRHDYWHRPLVHELLFVQNYQSGFWGHTWSL